jgi:hypothetical protein
MLFHNAQDYFARYPDDRGPTRFCAPRVTEGYELEAIRRRIGRRGRGAFNDSRLDRVTCTA